MDHTIPSKGQIGRLVYANRPVVHFVNVYTYSADRGRCSDCGRPLVAGDDWSTHQTLATC